MSAEAKKVDPPIVRAEATSGWLRCWMGLPDWSFRAAGAAFFIAYLWSRCGPYLEDWPRVGPYRWEMDADGAPIADSVRYFPMAKILTDLTFLLIILAFCFRLPPRRRASSARQIVIPLIAGFWPLTPFILHGLLVAVRGDWGAALDRMLGFGPTSLGRFYAGVILLTIGNALDVWGYGTLFRSLSIVAEARVLKTRGPYRFIRHPIYLGQFISQAGFWLVLVRLQAVWVAFYLLFVVMQLYRARIEETVLENEFGASYADYRRRTYWFV